MENKLRVALVGFGGMGQIYAKMIYAGIIPEMQLVGVCCRNEKGQTLLKNEFSGVSIYTDTIDMEAHQDEYEAVLIVTPHTTHVEIGIQMARLGKHLLIDKPIGVSAMEVKELLRVCKEKKVSVGTIFNNRRLPAFQMAKKLLTEETLGTLHRVVWVCNSWYRTPAYHKSAPWRSSWNGECGGLLINQNQHYLDMWQWLFGMPEKIYADMSFGRYNDFDVDDAVDIQFAYGNGLHGTMISATGEAPGVNRLEIWGTKGRIIVEDGSKVYLDLNEVSTEEFAKTNTEIYVGLPHEMKEIELSQPINPYAEVFANFAAHVLHGDALYSDGVEGLKTVELTNAAYVSGWEECKVTVPVEETRYAHHLKTKQLLEQKYEK